jgi:hypothetical protein
VSNPQPGWLDLYICSPVTGWPSDNPRHWVHRLLWLTGLQRRYSNPPPYRITENNIYIKCGSPVFKHPVALLYLN